MNKKGRIIYLFNAVIIGIFIFSSTGLASNFNPNFIISDEELRDASAMDITSIDRFLKTQGGYISNHQFKDAFGQYRSTAEIIYNAANNYECDSIEQYRSLSVTDKARLCEPALINPKALLVLLQKEQSLIDYKNPSQKRLDWATGYGVCDNCSKDDPAIQRFKGFGKQINSASLQFSDYMTNPQSYTYKAGNTYDISNTGRPNIIVTPQNQATAALYNYTPHVYNGNYNFYKLWLRYFTYNYPNGTLLQARGEPGVWLIQNGIKRPFLTKGALTSRYDINKVIQVNKAELERYSTGDPLKFPQYSLVRSPRGTVFLLVDDKRRGFASAEALRVIGINPEEIVNASWEDINVYEEGLPITATSSYPTGALLQDKTTGGIYYVFEGKKAPLWDSILLKTKFRWKSITPESPEKLASYETVAPAIFNDGELLKADSGRAVYVIDNNMKRPFISGSIFEELGYKWENIIPVPDKIINLYPEGEIIDTIYSDEELEDMASSTPDSLASSTSEVASSTDELDDIDRIKTNEELRAEVDAILNP